MTTTLDIPHGWQKIRLKWLANLNPSKSEVANLLDDAGVTFLPMEVVSESWEVDYSRSRPFKEVRNGYTYFRNGDILVAKITPCFENGKGALVHGCLNGFGFGTTEFHVIRSSNSETTRFLSYVVRSHRFMVEGAGMMTGTAGQKRLSDDYVKDFEVFLPPLSLRELIARFLDRKTAAIDTLIAKKQRLIELLEEKRIALINQAVTKGLNPNAPMKDSGISWIGEIPEHWGIKRFRHCGQIKNGQVDPKLPEFAQLPLYAPNHIQAGTGKLLGEVESAADQGAISGKYLVEAGEVVYSKIRPELRKVCIASQKGLCSADMYAISPLKGVTSKFLFWSLLSEGFSRLAILESERVAMPKINRETIADILFAIPPEEEQNQIVENIEHKIKAIDRSHRLIKAQIEKLQEYRRSLITAAVTGEIDPSNLEEI